MIKAIVTSLVLATLTSTAFAKTHFSSGILHPSLIPSGEVTITEIGRPQLSNKKQSRFMDYESDCTRLNTPWMARGGNNKNGGVVFDDGVSGTITTGNPELDVILNLGKAAWKLVQENAPVVSTKLASANALPQGITCWNQLERWQAVRAVDYKVEYTALAGNAVITYVARVIYAYGGSYQGKGRYIANAAVQNKEIKVWATNVLNVNVEIPQVLNAGTVEDPVAAMQVNLNIEAKNKFLPLVHHSNGVNFILYGDGREIQFLN